MGLGGSVSEAPSQQLDKHEIAAAVRGVRVGVRGSLNQHVPGSVARVGLPSPSVSSLAAPTRLKTAHQHVSVRTSKMQRRTSIVSFASYGSCSMDGY